MTIYWKHLPLLTPKELKALKNGTKVVCALDGEEKTVGKDEIDDDARFGKTAWAIDTQADVASN